MHVRRFPVLPQSFASEFFSIYFYITVCSRPIHFFFAENFLQWYKCLSNLQAVDPEETKIDSLANVFYALKIRNASIFG